MRVPFSRGDGGQPERYATVVAVNSSKPDLADGEVGHIRYDWIRESFEWPDDYRIFVLHHHLVSVPGTGRERNIVWDAGDLLALLIELEVDMVMSRPQARAERLAVRRDAPGQLGNRFESPCARLHTALVQRHRGLRRPGPDRAALPGRRRDRRRQLRDQRPGPETQSAARRACSIEARGTYEYFIHRKVDEMIVRMFDTAMDPADVEKAKAALPRAGEAGVRVLRRMSRGRDGAGRGGAFSGPRRHRFDLAMGRDGSDRDRDLERRSTKRRWRASGSCSSSRRSSGTSS